MSKKKKNSNQRFSNRNPYAGFKQDNKPTAKQAVGPVFFIFILIISIAYIIAYKAYMKNSGSQMNTPEPQNIESTTSDADQTAGEPVDSTSDVEQNPVETIDSTDEGTSSDGNVSSTTEDSDASKIVGVEDTITIVSEEDANAIPTPSVSMSDDRVVYKDGFFYQSLTDDVKERINGKSYKADCTIPYEDLRYLSVLYEDFDGNTKCGEIICNKAIAKDLVEIFCELYENHYQIDKIRLVDEYDADDDISCAENNTSCFNYRTVSGSNNLSKHSLGRAIDINPFQNPYVTYPDGKERISPPGSEPYANRKSGLPHMITEDDLCYKLFTAHGFTWGGHWKSLKDYQHFQKVD